MDTTSPFDLDQSILDWRRTLANSPAIRRGDLDELESHLRDSVVSLQATGLEAHEAFWVARNRLGGFETLDAEFGKVNLEQVWLDRVLWMVTGSIALGLGSGLINGLVTFATLGIFKLTTAPSFIGPVGLVLHVATLAVLFHYLWRSGKNQDGLICRAGRWLMTRPRTTGAIALFLTALSATSSAGAYALSAKLLPLQTYTSLLVWRWPAGMVVVLLWPAVLVWLLARKYNRQNPAVANSKS